MTTIQQMLFGGGDLLVNPVYDNLGELATYLSSYMSEYSNPSFYNYNLDGDSTYIRDGGSDMFDNGNVTTPILRSGLTYTSDNTSLSAFPFRISYSNTTPTLVDSDFLYASLGYSNTQRPLTVIGTRRYLGPVGWQKGGNPGADGGGLLSTFPSSPIIGQFTVYYYVRQIYNAADDPSICDVYMLIGHPNWGSQFGSRTSFSDNSTNSNGGYFFTSSATNILTAVTLLSKSGGVAVSSSEILTVVTNFVNRIGLYFGY